MAGKDMQDLYIGGEKITVPAWSTETTLSTVAGYSEATAKALTAMLKSQGKEGNVARDNNKLFKNMLNAQKNTTDQAEEAAKNADKAAKNADKASKKELAELKKASDDRIAQVKDLNKSFNERDLEGMTRAIAGTGLLGVAAGIAVGTIVQFSKDLTEMSNIGVGFGDTLLELKAHSTATGLSLADYGKLISGNMDGMVALGGTVHEGARLFSGLSRQIRNASNDFHQFGLSNMEMNQVIADEIELRRKSGMQQSLIAGNVAASMNDLMLETSALANITGQDRREVMRARNEAMNDEVTSAFIGTLSDAARENALGTNAIFSKLGAAGDTMFASIFGGMASGVDADVINSGALAKLAALSPEIGTMITGIDDFINSNLNNNDTPEFQAGLVALVAEMQNSIVGDERERLSLLANTNGAQAENARLLLGIVRDASGMNTDAAENEQEFMRTRVEMALSPLIGLGSALEDTVVTLQLAALETVIGGFDTLMAKILGDSDIVGAAGTSMIGALDALTAAYTDTDLVGGTKNLWQSLDASQQAIAAATAAILLLARTAGEGGIVGGIVGGAAVVGVAKLAKAAAGLFVRGGLTAVAMAAGATSMFVPLIAAAALAGGAIRGYFDEDLTDAGFSNGLDRTALGIGQTLLDGVDVLLNMAPGSEMRPEPIDLGGAFKDWATSPSGSNILSFGRTGREREEHFRSPEGQAEMATLYPPTERSPLSPPASERAPIIEHTTRIQPGQVRPTATGALETGMTTENAWRHGARGQAFLEEQRQFDQEQQQRQQQQGHHYQQETNQLLRRLITTIENN